MLIAVFIFGACIGSFFNVVLSRLYHEGGIMTGRSHCSHCRRTLAWYELVPLLSFFALRGRCRTCRQRISLRYPLVEFTTAALLTLFVARYGLPGSPELILSIILLCGFVLLFFFDAFWYVLPDAVVIPLVMLTIGYLIFQEESLLPALFVGFAVCALFAILYIVSRGRWVGFGDVKLVFLVGLAFGFPFGMLITLGAVWGATLAGILLLLARRATVKTALPFGAFLSAAVIIYILFAHEFENLRWIFA